MMNLNTLPESLIEPLYFKCENLLQELSQKLSQTQKQEIEPFLRYFITDLLEYANEWLLARREYNEKEIFLFLERKGNFLLGYYSLTSKEKSDILFPNKD